MTSWITVHPIFDDVTVITDDEAKDAIDYMKNHNAEVIDLPDEKAVRENFEHALKENPEANVAHWNHGSPEAWIGDDEKPVLDLKNVKLIEGREAFASNCSSAQKLGKEAHKHGCIYFGYEDVVSFTTDALDEFKEAFNFWIKRRIDGLSPVEALRKTKEKMTELIDKLLESGRVLAAACMRNDRDLTVCYTPETPPEESDCPFRSFAIRQWGPQIGWRLTLNFPLAIALFFMGLGILLHDYFHALWCEGGYKAILSPQGGYFGCVILIVGFLLAYYQIWSMLKSRVN